MKKQQKYETIQPAHNLPSIFNIPHSFLYVNVSDEWNILTYEWLNRECRSQSRFLFYRK